MAPRPCLQCGKPVATGSRHPGCDPARRARSTSQWQRVRAQVLAAQPWCSECGSRQHLGADHIVPAKDGGPNTIENCQVLCSSCNGRKRSAEGGGGGRQGWGTSSARPGARSPRRYVVTEGGVRVLAHDDPEGDPPGDDRSG